MAAISDEIQQKAEEMIGYSFADPSYLALALTHASVADERVESNERMEFLGDAVLGFVVCEHLFQAYPDSLEGELTKIKSAVVSRRTCAKMADRQGLTDLLKLGKGMSGQAKLPSSLAAAVYEAMVAAVYLDGGFEAAKRFILSTIVPHIEDAVESAHQQNFKSLLQQHAQKELSRVPSYVLLDEKGPDHAKCFEVCVELGIRQYPSAWGQTKKAAEQKAAMLALRELGVVAEAGDGRILLVPTPSESSES